MALSSDVVKSLRNEAEQLMTKLRDLVEESRRIEAKKSQYTTQLTAIKVLLSGQLEELSKDTGNEPATASLPPPTGLRDAILNTLAEDPRGGSPADISAKLAARGFTYSDGKTDLTVRVNNELYRLFKAGRITRAERGLYRPLRASHQN